MSMQKPLTLFAVSLSLLRTFPTDRKKKIVQQTTQLKLLELTRQYSRKRAP